MAELLNNSFQELTPEMLKTQDGVNILNNIIKQLVDNVPSDLENVRIFKGYGTPEASVTAGIGSLYMRVDGAVGTTTYQKQSGTGNTGWVAIPGTSGGGFGDVVGPASSTDNAIVRFDGTTGKLIQDSAITIADTSGNMAGVGTINTHTIPAGTDTFALLTATQTLTNKRISPRVVALTDAATVTPNIDTTDIGVLTSLSQDSIIANPTGTPVTGQGLILRITSTTSRALTFGSGYAASTTLTLPAATTGSSTEDYLGFRYNTTSSKWVIVASTIGLLGDFSSSVSVAVDSEIVLFSGTTGKIGKRSSGTGYAKLTSGVLSAQSTPIPVADGGSGAATLTGILVGNGTSAFSTVTAPSGTIVGTTDTQTLTNKRINPRVVTASDATSITPTGDTADVTHQTNTQAAGTLTINAPTGTPVDGQKLIIRIKSTNVHTLSFNSIYRAISVMTLPASTTGTSITDAVGFMYNSTDSKWDMLATTI